jgi:Extensin-like protein C-terminus
MTNAQCEAEADTRKIAFEFEEARGIAMPVRLLTPLHGVEFRLLGESSKAAASDEPKVHIHDIVDCRLVLALDDFAKILQSHDIVRVVHYSMWRPPSKDWPQGKIATRHAGGMALDAARFVTAAGKVLDVDDDFHGRIGAKTCGEGAGPKPSSATAKELRAVLCEAVAARIFGVVLTPNYNKAHKNHFHLEVMANKGWLLVD